MPDYNGWKNRQTWNVSLWLNNDAALYWGMMEFLRKRALVAGLRNKPVKYYEVIKWLGLEDASTPDGIKYMGSRLDYKELSAMVNEMYQEILEKCERE